MKEKQNQNKNIDKPKTNRKKSSQPKKRIEDYIPWEDLKITNEIDHIEYPELQKEMKPDRDAKSIRLDVYIRDNQGTIYAIEMQMIDTKELPKRTRYYQGIMDL